MTGRIAQRLIELQPVLPPPPLSVANYVAYIRDGRLVQVAGVAPTERGMPTIVGKVGRELDLAEGRRAARLCAFNLLATLKGACDDDLDRVTRVVMVRGFVNAAQEFEHVPLVIDGGFRSPRRGIWFRYRPACPHIDRLCHPPAPRRSGA